MPNSGESVQAQNSQSVLESIGRELFEEFFLGASKEEDVRKFLKTNEFRLYYKLPVSRNKIPTRLPLQIGYMSSEGKVTFTAHMLQIISNNVSISLLF